MRVASVRSASHLTFIAVATIVSSSIGAAQSPKREIRDPGVIATDQRVTPAGVQSVFDWRVTGVRFGTSSDVWVAVPTPRSTSPGLTIA